MKKSKAEIIEFLNTDRAVLLGCMALALMFWVVTKLSNDYKTSRTYAVVYNLPIGKSFKNKPSAEAEAYLEGSGWALLTSHLGNRNPKIVVNLPKDSLQSISNSALLMRINEQLGNEISCNNVAISDGDVELESEEIKVLPIKLNLNIKYADAFQLKSQKLSVDSIRISGPTSKLAKLQHWETEDLQIADLNEKKSLNILLKKPEDELLKIEPEQILVDIEVEEFTSKSFFLDIQVKDAPDSLKIYPSSVKLSCSVPLSRYNEVSKDNFKVEVDLGKIALHEENNTMPISLSQAPAFVKQIIFTPKSVTFRFVQNSILDGSEGKNTDIPSGR